MAVEIVAEIGINHNGSLATAKELILAAKEAGADTAKFQVFVPHLSCDGDPKLREILDNTFLGNEQFEELKDYCHDVGIGFLCSAFDRPSLDLLVGMGETRLKVPSSRNTIKEYVEYAKSLPFEQFLVSCGAAHKYDVDHYWIGSDYRLIQCISTYPCDPASFSIVIDTAWGPEHDGISDHSPSWEACIVGVCAGYSYVEKHLTLDHTNDGPDHLSSLEPRQFEQMVKEIRNVERIISGYQYGPVSEYLVIERKRLHNREQYGTTSATKTA